MNNKKISGKYQNTWRLDNTLVNNKSVKEEISRQNKNHSELNEK